MSYPYDSPSLLMSTVWASGNYTPNNVVRGIRDNYTPVNKNSMRNSVGQEISLVQNYVNSKYLGRSDVPIITGYITNIRSTNGEYLIETISGYSSLVGEQLTTWTNSNASLDVSYGVYNTSGYISLDAKSTGFLTWDTKQICAIGSGINISHRIGGYPKNINIEPDKILFNASGNGYTTYTDVGFISHSNISGGFIEISGNLVIGSGMPHIFDSSAFNPAYPASLTVRSQKDIYGNAGGMYIKTSTGAIVLKGASLGINKDIIYSEASELDINCGNSTIILPSSGNITLPVNATDPATSYALVNAIKALLIERGYAS